ncbi:MAG: hypothetical protein J7J20_02930 [Desulfurococcales archaeon]|nr:hypothetical protein [Desulfurococcales archaeon]
MLGVVKLEEVYVKAPTGTEGAVGVYLVKCLNCRELYILPTRIHPIPAVP